MIAQARIRPGMSVIEVGSSGYNAALLAEITGPSGRVVSVGIDPDITALAVTGLRAAGYGDRVTVVTADAGASLPGDSLYDAIVVTAGAWDMTIPSDAVVLRRITAARRGSAVVARHPRTGDVWRRCHLVSLRHSA
jgi:protein-L-isoaspartate O-methyltransferase